MDEQDDATHSEWVTLQEVIEAVGIEAARRHHIEQVRPLALCRSGDYQVIRNPIADGIESTIHKMLADSDERRTFNEDTLSMLHYTEVVYSTVALVAWMRTHAIPVPAEWKHRIVEPAANDESVVGGATNTSLVSYEQLQTLSGRRTPAEVRLWLDSKSIPYQTGVRGRPFTTNDALNKSMGVTPNASNDNHAAIPPKRIIKV